MARVGTEREREWTYIPGQAVCEVAEAEQSEGHRQLVLVVLLNGLVLSQQLLAEERGGRECSSAWN